MDLEPLPPNPDEFWTSPGPNQAEAMTSPLRSGWSTRARVAAAVSAVGIAGVAGFGLTEVATGGSVPAFGSLLAASSSPSTAPAPGAPAHKTPWGAAFGAVSNLSGANFTVSNTRRATTSTTNVVTDGNTVFTKTFKGAVGDIKTGQTIAATGARNADGSIAASDVVVLPDGALAGKAPASPPPTPAGQAPAGEAPAGQPAAPGMRMRGGAAIGTVKSVSNGVITITTRRGDTQTIDTTSSTTVIETTKAALSDVTNGATVAVVGTPASDNSHLTATRVEIIDPALIGSGGMFGFGGFGPRAGAFFIAPFPGGPGGHRGGHFGAGVKPAAPATAPSAAS